MGLRAIILGWEEAPRIAASHRERLLKILSETREGFPTDGETATASTGPVPASAVAARLVSAEPSLSLTPWEDPPLASASRVVCFESSDEGLLDETAKRCLEELGDAPGISVMLAEARDRRYTSATIATIAYDPALGRQSREDHPEVLLWPCRRIPAWWELSPLQRQALFLPRLDADSNVVAPGHVLVSEPIVPIVHRRLYHESLPDAAPGVMMGWFETSPQHMDALREVVANLQDVGQSPDHAYYQSGPLWWGRRVPVEDLEAELQGA